MAQSAVRRNTETGHRLADVEQDHLFAAREVLQAEAAAIAQLSENLNEQFELAVEQILSTSGSLILSGIGKAGLIGQKLAATFASTGTPSHFVHPAEAIHGDLGRIGPRDLVLLLSYSGETEEITRLLPWLRNRESALLAMTGNRFSSLAKAASIVLLLPSIPEACHNHLAPSTSTTMMLALGDALALVVSRARGFTPEAFAEFHPGGSLGRKLRKVDEAMRGLDDCRIASTRCSVRDVIVHASRPGRRTGAVMLTDDSGCLCGIFTDSDLARLLEQRHEQQLDAPIEAVMTRRFTAIQSGAWLRDAVHVLSNRKISELPVIDAAGRPIGLIDITDILKIVDSDSVDEDDTSTDRSHRTATIRIFGED